MSNLHVLNTIIIAMPKQEAVNDSMFSMHIMQGAGRNTVKDFQSLNINVILVRPLYN